MANRQYSSSIGRTITLQDVQRPGGVRVADENRVNREFDEIFSKVAFADPSVAGVWGNHDGSVLPITTPGTANAEFAVAHQLGRTPVGFSLVVPLIANYGTADLTVTRAPDGTYVYLKSSVTNQRLAIVVW